VLLLRLALPIRGGGQSLIAEMRQKVRPIREMTDLPIGADGGITSRGSSPGGRFVFYKVELASEMRKIIEAGRRAARR
jgi:hypothetical protein